MLIYSPWCKSIIFGNRASLQQMIVKQSLFSLYTSSCFNKKKGRHNCDIMLLGMLFQTPRDLTLNFFSTFTIKTQCEQYHPRSSYQP